MNVIVFGAGLMGRATAFFLAHSPQVKKILVVDHAPKNLSIVENILLPAKDKKKLTTQIVDIHHTKKIMHLIKKFDVIAAAIPWKPTFALIQCALAAKVPLVSITRPDYHDIPLLNNLIQSAPGRIMLGCGLEPGLTEILTHFINQKFNLVQEVHIKCGGIPTTARPPLFYASTFTENSLPIQPKKAFYIHNGTLLETERFSGVEPTMIEGIGLLESWHDGMLPWLIELPGMKNVSLCTQKTLRWPGFANKIQTLQELGLLQTQPIKIKNRNIPPKQFVETVLQNSTRFTQHDRDVVILQIRVKGIAHKISTTKELTLIDHYDNKQGMSAMSRVTGYTLALCATLIHNHPNERCLIRPEIFFTTDKTTYLIKKLIQQGISINQDG